MTTKSSSIWEADNAFDILLEESVNESTPAEDPSDDVFLDIKAETFHPYYATDNIPALDIYKLRPKLIFKP